MSAACDAFVSRVLAPAVEDVGYWTSMAFGLDAQVLLTAISGQEAGWVHRIQMGGGPAHGLFQFELGTKASRGGVTGLMLHPVSAPIISAYAKRRGVRPVPMAIYEALVDDDFLAVAVARAALWIDPHRLPSHTDQEAGWDYYNRIWRPGKPHPSRWPANHAAAVEALVP